MFSVNISNSPKIRMFLYKIIKLRSSCLPISRRVNIYRCFHEDAFPQERIRNIGILAHIDAGKTTTTERMLFYAGKTRMLGEVHHGTTVTDFLVQERERGITICSAAVSFNWKDHKINLLDTPGHIDFTMEVEQCLGAVDGNVVILDASAGVEAQTVTVWYQADRYKLPRIVFVNKMDRADADYQRCLNDLKNKLGANPLPLQWPIRENNKLIGIIDVLGLKKISWDTANEGRSYKVEPLTGDQLSFGQNKLNEVIDTLSGLDDKLAERIIENGSLEDIDIELILNAVRATTISQKIVPTFLGSAYKNTGVQLLIDAVLNFLPAPNERNEIYDCFENDFVAKVFKVVHDKQRGPLSLIRTFRGNLKKGSKLTTIRGATESLQRIYDPLADEYKEISVIGPGNIGICAGLKTTCTGDLIFLNNSSLRNAQMRMKKKMAKVSETDLQNDFITEFGLESKIPDAVYFCSIEPPSTSYQVALDNALKQIQREDPSLRVKYDETTSQTVLGGMGELHLEIIKSRILTEYNIEVDLGPLQIAYRETLESPSRGSWNVEKDIGGNKQSVLVELTLDCFENKQTELFKLDNSSEALDDIRSIHPRYVALAKKGALAAIAYGPNLGGQLVGASIILHKLVVGRATADSFILASISQCVRKILKEAQTRLLEPIMLLEIVAQSDRVSSILSDLGKRRATILEVNKRGEQTNVIKVNAPLAELSGYSSILRTISSGNASMSMQPSGYSLLNSRDQTSAIRRAQGME